MDTKNSTVAPHVSVVSCSQTHGGKNSTVISLLLIPTSRPLSSSEEENLLTVSLRVMVEDVR